jgi:steroid delta-isomerase-like uncharacterized protein
MSQELERVARKLFDEVWNRGDLDQIPQLITNDYVNNDPINSVKGIDGMRRLVTKYRTAFPDCRLDVDESLSAGNDAVIVRWRFSGTQRGQLEGIKATGRTVNGTGLTLYRFSGNRIKEAFTNWDALGMMQQLGVVTLPGKATAAGV